MTTLTGSLYDNIYFEETKSKKLEEKTFGLEKRVAYLMSAILVFVTPVAFGFALENVWHIIMLILPWCLGLSVHLTTMGIFGASPVSSKGKKPV